jgi:hypothetical protein
LEVIDVKLYFDPSGTPGLGAIPKSDSHDQGVL